MKLKLLMAKLVSRKNTNKANKADKQNKIICLKTSNLKKLIQYSKDFQELPMQSHNSRVPWQTFHNLALQAQAKQHL